MRKHQTSEAKAGKPTPDEGKGPLIYIVDDEPMLLELASIVLEPAGYQVQTFREPKEAMQSFIQAQPRPDLVITDYAMRLMNGMDIVVQCKALHPGQKVVLISGTVGREVFENAPVKPDRFLAKPYQAEELRDLVKALVG